MISNVLVCFFFSFVLTFSNAVKSSEKEIMEVIGKCMAESEIEESQMGKLFMTELDDKSYSMAKCALEGLEIVDNNHEIQNEAILVYTREFPEEVKNEILACTKGKNLEPLAEMEGVRKCIEPSFKKYMRT